MYAAQKIKISCSVFFVVCSFLFYCIIPPGQGHKEIDTHEYELVAENFAQTGYLFYADQPWQMPSHTIGYHFFLGMLHRVMGYCCIPLIVSLQLLLALCCCWLIYFLALYLFGSSVALLALCLAVSNFGILIYTQLLMADIVLMLFLTGFLLSFLCFIQQHNKSALCLAALLLGTSVIIRPVALFFIVPLCIFIAIGHHGTVRSKIQSCLLFLALFYVPVCSYMFYNKKMYDTFAVTNLVNENLYLYFLPLHIIPALSTQERALIEQQLTHSGNTMATYQQIFREVAHKHPFLIMFTWIKLTLKIFFGLHATPLKAMFNPSIKGGAGSFLNMSGNNFMQRLHNYVTFGTNSTLLHAYGWLEIAFLLLRYLLIVLACIVLLYKQEYFLLAFFLCFIGYFALIGGHDGSGRYRMMFEPVLIVLTAFALHWLYRMLRYYTNARSWHQMTTRALS